MLANDFIRAARESEHPHRFKAAARVLHAIEIDLSGEAAVLDDLDRVARGLIDGTPNQPPWLVNVPGALATNADRDRAYGVFAEFFFQGLSERGLIHARPDTNDSSEYFDDALYALADKAIETYPNDISIALVEGVPAFVPARMRLLESWPPSRTIRDGDALARWVLRTLGAKSVWKNFRKADQQIRR